MRPHWVPGNRFSLLENGEGYFPRVFEAIEQARSEVLLETFILFEDKVGQQLQQVLLAAARRGVRISVLVDGYGSSDLTPEFLGALTEAGVRFHVFDPRPKLMGMRTNVFRRMHRKLVIVDGEVAFIGGINFSADHLGDFGPLAKQDYAVEARGPIVAEIRTFAYEALQPPERRLRRWTKRRAPRRPAETQAAAGEALAMFVTRDNDRHRKDIEQQYRVAIRAARREIIIANAYFFPGYRLLRDIRNAAKRGVKVTLILQGEPDMPIVKVVARLLHNYLLSAGVRIFEYCERPLHGKVALADDQWSTVGSSNLDPLSLALNLEANVVIRDRDFTAQLRASLDRLIEKHCSEVAEPPGGKSWIWRATVGFVVFHFLHRFPAWAGLLPAHTPRLTVVPPPSRGSEPDGDVPSHEAG